MWVVFDPPLWNKFVRLFVIFLQVAQHQERHQDICLQEKVVTVVITLIVK